MSDRIGEKDLVRVRSQDELRPGMTVVVKLCPHCASASHVMLLLRRVEHGSKCQLCNTRSKAWDTGFNHPGCRDWCFCRSIPEGRLYRLRDLDNGDEAKREAECDKDDKRRVGARIAVEEMAKVRP